MLTINRLIDTDPNSSSSKNPSSSSSSNGAIIGGVIAAVVVLLIALVVAYCFHRNKRNNLSEGPTREVGEFQNPAYEGDSKMYIEPREKCDPETRNEPPPPYLSFNNPTHAAVEADGKSSQLNVGVYERVD